MPLKEAKAVLRAQAKQKRLALPPETRQQAALTMQRKVFSILQLAGIRQVLCYVSSSEIEIDTLFLIRQLLDSGMEIAVPKCTGTGNDMTFHVIRSLDELKRGYYRILEPDTEKCPAVVLSEPSACIVPGLVFDEKGYRIGFGKGYYDKFLSAYTGKTFGLCYDCCVVNALPAEPHDRPVDFLVTESTVYTSDNQHMKEELDL